MKAYYANGDYWTNCPDCGKHNLFVSGDSKFCYNCAVDDTYEMELWDNTLMDGLEDD